MNQFDTLFVTRVFLLIICNGTVKVLTTFKPLSRHD